MMEYKTIEIQIGRNLKSTLDMEIKTHADDGWRYIEAVDNEAMGTVIIVFERRIK